MALTTQTLQQLFTLHDVTDDYLKVLGTKKELGKVVLSNSKIKTYLGNSNILKADVVYDPANFGPGDCIVVQEGRRRKLIYGTDPGDTFGAKWGNWVNNPSVQASAINYILVRRPAAISLVIVAIQPMELVTAFEDWMSVANAVLDPLLVSHLYERTLKGKAIPMSGQVKAMPIRIAQFLKGWHAPIPRPAFTKIAPEFVSLPIEKS